MSKARVPIREGYFVKEKNGGHLIATRCKSCSQIYFPPLQRCLECYEKDMEEIELSGKGKLYTYTVIQMPVSHYKPPFALAWVELPEGVRVFTQLKHWENTELQIGMDMKLVIDNLWEEEEKVVYGYKFEPSS
jgi:uncharacterized OB-fold protein